MKSPAKNLTKSRIDVQVDVWHEGEYPPEKNKQTFKVLYLSFVHRHERFFNNVSDRYIASLFHHRPKVVKDATTVSQHHRLLESYGIHGISMNEGHDEYIDEPKIYKFRKIKIGI